MGFDLPVMNRLRRSGRALSPASLFATGAQGVIYDPRDLTTMFQDSAGTTPVTAPGQPVGLRLDKSKGGPGPELVSNGDFSNGQTGWTDGPTAPSGWTFADGVCSGAGAAGGYQNVGQVVSGKTYVAEFTISSYANGSLSLINSVVGAFGTVFNGDGVKRQVFTAGATGTIGFVRRTTNFTGTIDNFSVRELPGNHATQATAGARLTYGIEPKTGTRNLLLATDTLAAQSLTVTAVPHTLAFTGTGTVTLSGASTAGPLVGTGVGNRVTLTFTPTAASLALTVLGSVTLAQLEAGSVATPYQKVVTAFEVTEAGIPTCHYCAYAGANSMASTAVDFTATNSVSIFAGVRKLSDATRSQLLESGIGNEVGSFGFAAPNPSGANNYQFVAGGTTLGGVTVTGFVAPVSNVISGFSNISVPSTVVRANGVQVGQGTFGLGTGTFSNYPIYFGRRGGSALAFTGRDYGIVIVGKATSAAEINITEAWLAANTPTVVL